MGKAAGRKFNGMRQFDLEIGYAAGRKLCFEWALRGAQIMWVRAIISIVLSLLPAAAFAQVEKRIALLIGNQGYGSEIGRQHGQHREHLHECCAGSCGPALWDSIASWGT